MKSLLLASCVIAVLGVRDAGATTITFNGASGVFSTYVEAGFQLTNTFSSGTNNFAGCSPACANNGTVNAFLDGGPVDLTTSPAGSAFSALSFDAGELFQGVPSTWSSQIVVTGTLSGGGTVSSTFFLDGLHSGANGVGDMQTFLLPASFGNLTSIRFWDGSDTDGRGFTLDNIVLGSPTATAVPEPTSLFLLGTGLAGAGIRRYRRRRS